LTDLKRVDDEFVCFIYTIEILYCKNFLLLTDVCRYSRRQKSCPENFLLSPIFIEYH